jgi:hypothetical protein
MTLAFLRCSTGAPTEARPLPADLEAAAKQLRAATQYKNVQLWDTVPLHLQEGRLTDHSFRLPYALPNLPGTFATAQVRIVPEAVSRREGGRFVRFERVTINFRIPYLTGAFQPGPQGLGTVTSGQVQFQDVGLNTAGDFKEGQKTVLGKISGIDDESAIFVVISLKVLD